MRTITIDIIDEDVLTFLKDLELRNLIRLRKEKHLKKPTQIDWSKFKGVMSKQPLKEVNQQINELRNEWE